MRHRPLAVRNGTRDPPRIHFLRSHGRTHSFYFSRTSSITWVTDPTPYLLLPGYARDALTFYGGVFGCAVQLHTFAEFGRTDGPADAIAHDLPEGQGTDRWIESAQREVAGEDGDRVVARTRDVDVQVVRRDHDAARDGETVHSSDTVGLGLREVCLLYTSDAADE